MEIVIRIVSRFSCHERDDRPAIAPSVIRPSSVLLSPPIAAGNRFFLGSEIVAPFNRSIFFPPASFRSASEISLSFGVRPISSSDASRSFVLERVWSASVGNFRGDRATFLNFFSDRLESMVKSDVSLPIFIDKSSFRNINRAWRIVSRYFPDFTQLGDPKFLSREFSAIGWWLFGEIFLVNRSRRISTRLPDSARIFLVFFSRQQSIQIFRDSKYWVSSRWHVTFREF